jgi:hypothetical protein
MGFGEKILTELPMFLSIPFFCDWLEMEDLGRFDTAECNKLTRSHFTDIMSSNLAVFVGLEFSKHQISTKSLTGTQSAYLNWLQMRSMSVKKIGLDMFGGVNYIDLFAYVIHEKQCCKADTLHLSCDPNNGFISLTLLNRLAFLFPRLVTLTLDNVRIHNDHDLKLALEFPHLRELTMNDATLTEGVVLQIINNCQLLEKFSFADSQVNGSVMDGVLEKLSQNGSSLIFLDLRSGSVSDIAILTNLIAKCPLLEECNLINFEGMDDAVAECILAHCPNYKHFHTNSDLLTDAAVTSIATKCPQLVTLDVDDCDVENLTDKSLRLIAQHCHALEVFDVADEAASVATICSVLANCKQIKNINALNLTTCEGEGPSMAVEVVSNGPCLQLDFINVDGDNADDDDDDEDEETSSAISDSLFYSIANVAPNLTVLNMVNARVSDGAFISIMRNCLLLTSLDVSSCDKLTTASMTALNKNQKLLVSLDLRYTKIASTASIKNLVKNNPNLTSVSWTYHTKSSPDAAMEELKLHRPELTISYSNRPGRYSSHNHHFNNYLPHPFFGFGG